MTFVGILKAIGRDFAKGLKYAVQYAIPVEELVAVLFPGTAPAMGAAADATKLIQNAVLLVEQKYAASGAQNGTGAQKLSEVMLLAGDAVTSLLAKAGINTSADYVESLISAVVAILNAQSIPAASTSAAAAK